jgi:hypothetical protein
MAVAEIRSDNAHSSCERGNRCRDGCAVGGTGKRAGFMSMAVFTGRAGNPGTDRVVLPLARSSLLAQPPVVWAVCRLSECPGRVSGAGSSGASAGCGGLGFAVDLRRFIFLLDHGHQLGAVATRIRKPHYGKSWTA